MRSLRCSAALVGVLHRHRPLRVGPGRLGCQRRCGRLVGGGRSRGLIHGLIRGLICGPICRSVCGRPVDRLSYGRRAVRLLPGWRRCRRARWVEWSLAWRGSEHGCTGALHRHRPVRVRPAPGGQRRPHEARGRRLRGEEVRVAVRGPRRFGRGRLLSGRRRPVRLRCGRLQAGWRPSDRARFYGYRGNSVRRGPRRGDSMREGRNRDLWMRSGRHRPMRAWCSRRQMMARRLRRSGAAGDGLGLRGRRSAEALRPEPVGYAQARRGRAAF